ncbi:hypothetical protein M885DRAFT_575290 [Pelagophyceae sp. CCMP2097]|nr:hypothetical protein M885DRAFT_575290 [Pelagophyceae sp. CCMP2097]
MTRFCIPPLAAHAWLEKGWSRKGLSRLAGVAALDEPEVYTVKLVMAQAAMAVFHEVNSDYDADEDDELGSAIYDQKFTTPSSIVAPRGADTMRPPCENASEDGGLE